LPKTHLYGGSKEQVTVKISYYTDPAAQEFSLVKRIVYLNKSLCHFKFSLLL